jgi:arylsulfatase A-like enzyme
MPVHRRSLFLLLFVLAAVPGCRQPPRQRPPGILLVSIDTLRPDHLGCYGYPPPTSPAIDRLCAESVVFDHASAHAPSTLPSHASILTSLLPHHHGASFENKRALPDEILTLAEVVAAAGYRTAAFTGGGQIDPIFGLGQGFEEYRVPASSDFTVTVDKGLKWLDQVGDAPFFLFLHTYQVHHPYEPAPEVLAKFESGYDGPFPDHISVETIRAINASGKPLPEADLRHIVATYDAEIREADDAFADLVEGLRGRGLWDSTVVIFTSDHGEEFAEHGYVGWHSHTLYEELLHVPLVIKLPAGREAGRRVDRLVRSIDIAPTALKAVGLRVPEQFSGIDLAALWSGREVPPLVAVSRLDRADKAKVSAIRDERFKLERLYSRRERLFDLADDPQERWDASSSFPGEVGRLLALYDGILASRPTPAQLEVDPGDDLKKSLEDLGYIQ